MLKKLYATWRVYDVIKKSMVARVKSGRTRDDALQMLLNCGDNTRIVVGFNMALIVAGSGSNGATGTFARGAICKCLLNFIFSELVDYLPRCTS